jgi:hypothetical protein
MGRAREAWDPAPAKVRDMGREAMRRWETGEPVRIRTEYGQNNNDYVIISDDAYIWEPQEVEERDSGRRRRRVSLIIAKMVVEIAEVGLAVEVIDGWTGLYDAAFPRG